MDEAGCIHRWGQYRACSAISAFSELVSCPDPKCTHDALAPAAGDELPSLEDAPACVVETFAVDERETTRLRTSTVAAE